MSNADGGKPFIQDIGPVSGAVHPGILPPPREKRCPQAMFSPAPPIGNISAPLKQWRSCCRWAWCERRRLRFSSARTWARRLNVQRHSQRRQAFLCTLFIYKTDYLFCVGEVLAVLRFHVIAWLVRFGGNLCHCLADWCQAFPPRLSGRLASGVPVARRLADWCVRRFPSRCLADWHQGCLCRHPADRRQVSPPLLSGRSASGIVCVRCPANPYRVSGREGLTEGKQSFHCSSREDRSTVFLIGNHDAVFRFWKLQYFSSRFRQPVRSVSGFPAQLWTIGLQ